MRFYKIVKDGFLLCVGTCGSQCENEITEEEYLRILAVIRAKPAAPEGYEYILKDDLTWQSVEMQLVDEEPEDGE